ncbi:MAG: DHH family phosphoesterase [Sedimentisphaerales bacterium]|nr:DHH family phosphoesterase [Sedimentisphaerales bacterium]
MVALKNVIEQACPTTHVKLLSLSNVGDMYTFMLPDDVWILDKNLTRMDIEAGKLDAFDLIIIVDTRASRQLEGISDYLTQYMHNKDSAGPAVLIIDHHLSGDIEGSCHLVDTRAAAAGEIIYELCKYAGWNLDQNSASALLAAIGTDTGWFRFENTSAQTFDIASQLVSAGAKPDTIYQKINQNHPPERVRLLALTLDTLELHADNRLAIMHITNEMLKQTGAKRSHIENIVNEPQQIGSVIAVALLVELENGHTRASLRSKSLINVNEIAQTYGGGGHARAAGLTIDEPLHSAKIIIINTIIKALDQT